MTEPSGDLRAAILKAIRTARIVDPDDGTVPFFKTDEYLVWTGPKLLVDTIITHIQPFLATQWTAGGLLPAGRTEAVNRTGQPERVLSGADIERLTRDIGETS